MENVITSVVVAGSRGFTDYAILEEHVKDFLKGKYPHEVEIVSGGAAGADRLGEQFAKENGCFIKQMKPDWDRFGRGAGHRRNEEMAIYADEVVVFWDGVSKGSASMREYAKKYNKRLRTVFYDTFTTMEDGEPKVNFKVKYVVDNAKVE